MAPARHRFLKKRKEKKARHRLPHDLLDRVGRCRTPYRAHRVHSTRSMCIAVITSDPIPPVKPSTRSCFSSPNLAYAFLIRRGRSCAAQREEEAYALWWRRRRGSLAGAQRHGRVLAGMGRSPTRYARRSICHCLYPYALILASFPSLFIYAQEAFVILPHERPHVYLSIRTQFFVWLYY